MSVPAFDGLDPARSTCLPVGFIVPQYTPREYHTGSISSATDSFDGLFQDHDKRPVQTNREGQDNTRAVAAANQKDSIVDHTAHGHHEPAAHPATHASAEHDQHAGHGQHDQHAGHDKHEGHDLGMFQRRFWICLI